MRNGFVRVAVATAVLVAASLALSADERIVLTPEEAWTLKRSEAVTAELERRDARLAQELDAGQAPDWAGRYHHGDGLGVNVTVTLAPKGGFTYTWYGCLGRYDANYGSVTAANGRVALDFELPSSSEDGPSLAAALVPVRWGERMYLIEVGQMREFANAINSGREPCNRFCSEFLLRQGDELIETAGRPELPADWNHYLLAQPIEVPTLGTLASSVTPDPHSPPDEPWSWRKTTLRIAAGRHQGVWEGMAFYDTAPDSSGTEFVIVKVGDDTSTVAATELVSGAGEDDEFKAPASLSTRMFRRPPPPETDARAQ